MNKIFIRLILILLFQSFVSNVIAMDTVKINEKNALFTVQDQTLPIITTKYIGWGENWKWASAKIKATQIVENKKYKKTDFDGQVKKLGIKFTGSVRPVKNSLIWQYDWQKSISLPNAKGFGVEFKLSDLKSSEQQPKLLENNRGWSWKAANNKFIEVVFEPRPAMVYFERGNKDQIRVLFFRGISVGSGSSRMTVKVNDGVVFSGPASTAYEKIDFSWHKDILPPLSSPIDLSFLNKNDIPAGKQGFIKRDKDQLFFENGSPAKFWGANVQANALFQTPDADIKRHAKRIAQLGFNLIRIHHHDSAWVKPNIFKNPENNTHEFSDSAIKKIDWWIKCLKDEGVYLWLDLHVGRRFTKNDGISGFSDFSKGKDHAEAKGFNYYNKDVQSLMLAFNKAYLNHVNPFTKLAYKDDPAVIALLITNENDVTHHFGNKLLRNKNVPVHHDIFSKDVEKFARTFGLSKHKVGQTWLMGESKIYLNDVEHRFNELMINQLEGLGVKSLVATTNLWSGMGVFGLPALTDGSIIDTHVYGRADEFKNNPRFTPGFLTRIGGSQVTGYPLSVTEWNVEPFPVQDRFTTPVFFASIANLQGWDAIMLYGYSQSPLGRKGKGSNYSSYNDPAIMGLMPAAALLYRQNHVSLAKKSYELKLNRDDFFFKRQDPSTSKTLRTLLETSRLTIAIPKTPELQWLRDNTVSESNSIVIHDANKDFIPVGQSFVESDTRELKRDWSKGIHTINTEKSQVASGWIGGELIDLADVSFKIKTGNAVVAVQSADGQAINKSNKIFITVMARSKPEKGHKLPFISEPVIGQVDISAPKGLRLYPINKLGKLDNEILIQRDAVGKYNIQLSPEMKYHWFMLQNETPAFEINSPVNGAVYTEGDLIKFKTNSAQQKGVINKVEFWHDNVALGKEGIVLIDQSTRNLTPGKHTIYSRATFGDGSHSDSKISLTIKDAPFRITHPYKGESFIEGQPIVIKTNASKWAGRIKQVNFWKNKWKYLEGDKTEPYEYILKKLPIGEHILRTRIIFKDGKKSDSSISITVVKTD